MEPPTVNPRIDGGDGRDQDAAKFGDDVPSTRSSSQNFQSLTMIEVLEQDSRPAMVLDLEVDKTCLNLKPVFQNRALRETHGLIDILTGDVPPDLYGQPVSSTYSAFKTWALDATTAQQPAGFLYHGMTWTSMTINKRWRMVNGIKERQQDRLTGTFSTARWGPKVDSVLPLRKESDAVELAAEISDADRKSVSATFLQQALGTTHHYLEFDSTSTCLPADTNEHIKLFRNLDWAKTPLGPMKSWSTELRHTANLLMGTPTPAVVLWGPELTLLYNEAYPEIVPDKVPGLMGNSVRNAFPGSWETWEPFFQRCAESGHGATFEDMQLFLDRGFGPQEECYVSFSHAPVFDDNGLILGWFQHITETTRRKVAERRMATILQIGERTATARNVNDFWPQLTAGLEADICDTSFALLYSVFEDSTTHSDSDSAAAIDSEGIGTKKLQLEGSVGVPKGHIAAPAQVNGNDLAGITEHFREAHQTGEPLLLQVEDGTLAEDLVLGLHSREFLDPCTAVVIIEIVPTTGYPSHRNTAVGYVVLGLNTRRPFDSEYFHFIQVLRRQITTSMAAVLLLEEEIPELEDRSLQLQNFADCVPVGIFVLKYSAECPDGNYVYRNDKWYELIGAHTDSESTPNESPIWELMHKDDYDEVKKSWTGLMLSEEPCTKSFSFRVPRMNGAPVEDDPDPHWILTYAFSILDGEGKLNSIIGSLTDITEQKRAEDTQKLRKEEALESKRQQETFIDVTSHEMRNPLGAILLSADEIISSLQSVQCKIQEADSTLQEVLKNSIDAAQVIVDCAQHQKRIVDDILTVSKLDSGLFSISPIEVQPTTVVNNLLKMFGGEFASAAITQHLQIDQSFHEQKIDRLLLDSSRLLQILINIVTNAIKFTKFQETRTITINISASTVQPTKTIRGHDYLPAHQCREDLTAKPEWGDGEVIYLEFAVEDSGRGLTVDEMQLLFMRFSQAPKTHVNYGGSGLGLFISRELVELQGGQICVASAGKHKGSDFSFYIKARRTGSATDYPARERGYSIYQCDAQSAYAVRSAIEHAADGASLRKSAPKSLQFAEAPTLENTSRHALIVEDNIVNQKVLKKQLVNLGYKVSIANHGIECLDFLKTTRFSKNHENNGTDLTIVLMDSEMPIMDGLTCVRRIRELQKVGALVAHVPVIAITANARIEQVNDLLLAGMDDVVSKPFRIPELIAQIEKLETTLNKGTHAKIDSVKIGV
ncbi:hypothetical protein EJ08DRAFT_702707 [Tothia fuscella]|uniref:Histidine kinase n=1 Tax=Tothia fuscella TaxID=1048955 RepID=A0A9P4NFZ8_9PEZI|nr:hypothetical protein EJ08DRAFT_702707 [Tothia fuscella]